MTDIAALKERVVEAAKEHAKNHPTAFPLEVAIRALECAEEAERRPALKSARKVAEGAFDRVVSAGIWQLNNVIVARDAEWLAAIRGLEQQLLHRVSGALPAEPYVALSDIETLARSAKP